MRWPAPTCPSSPARAHPAGAGGAGRRPLQGRRRPRVEDPGAPGQPRQRAGQRVTGDRSDQCSPGTSSSVTPTPATRAARRPSTAATDARSGPATHWPRRACPQTPPTTPAPSPARTARRQGNTRRARQDCLACPRPPTGEAARTHTGAVGGPIQPGHEPDAGSATIADPRRRVPTRQAGTMRIRRHVPPPQLRSPRPR